MRARAAIRQQIWPPTPLALQAQLWDSLLLRRTSLRALAGGVQMRLQSQRPPHATHSRSAQTQAGTKVPSRSSSGSFKFSRTSAQTHGASSTGVQETEARDRTSIFHHRRTHRWASGGDEEEQAAAAAIGEWTGEAQRAGGQIFEDYWSSSSPSGTGKKLKALAI